MGGTRVGTEEVTPPEPNRTPRERWTAAEVRSWLRRPDGPSIRSVIQTGGFYPLAVITALNAVDELDRAVLSVFAPNIRRYFGINNAELGAIIGAQGVLMLLVSIPIGYLGTRRDRARILRWSALVWGGFSALTALAVSLPAFVITRVATGIGKASVDPIGKSLLTDYYPPSTWNRVLAIHSAANPAGFLIGPLIAGAVGVAAAGDAAWRWAFVATTVPTAVALVAARRLREPESQMVKSLSAEALTITGGPSGLSFREAASSILRIPTFRRMLIGIGVLGFALVGFGAFSAVLFEEEFGVGEGGRGLIAAFLASGSLMGTLVGGRIGERAFATNPARTTVLAGAGIAAFSALLAVGVLMPSIWMAMPVMFVAVACVGATNPALVAALSAICAPRLRPLIFAMLGLLIALFGGIAGAVIVGAIADATNMRVGLTSLLPFGILGGFLMARAGSTVCDDIAAVSASLQPTSVPEPGDHRGAGAALD